MASFRHERAAYPSSETPFTKNSPNRLDTLASYGENSLQKLTYAHEQSAQRIRMIEKKLASAKGGDLAPRDWLELNKDMGDLRRVLSTLSEQSDTFSSWLGEHEDDVSTSFLAQAQKTLHQSQQKVALLREVIDRGTKIVQGLQKQLSA